jgi:hypothetical protein
MRVDAMHPNDGFPSARALRLGAATVAGVIVLLVGLAIGRATASGSSAPANSGGTSSTPPAPTVPAWAAGATRMDHGVPVGYAHTAEGALAAARNYDLALNATPLIVDPVGTRAAYAVVSTPSFRQRNAVQLERSLAGSALIITAAHQGHRTRAVPFILTVRVDRYTADQAQISVWGGAILAADGVLAPQEMTAEQTYTLRWLGDWQIDDLADTDGPGVKSLTAPAQTTLLPDEMGSAFSGVGDVSAR